MVGPYAPATPSKPVRCSVAAGSASTGLTRPCLSLGSGSTTLPTIGYKYHLSDYAAALGLANLDGFAERLVVRRALAQQYRDGLRYVPGLTLFGQQADRQSAEWLFGCHVENRLGFVRALKAKGIASSVVHDGIDRNTLFGGKRPELTRQRRLDETQIHVPLHDAMTGEQVAYIVDIIRQGW